MGKKKTLAGLAYIEVILAGVLWGCMGLFVRNLNAIGLSTMGIVAIRCFITCLLVFLYLLIFRRELLKIRLKDIWCFVGTGLCSILFFNFCYFKTMTLTSLSIAAILLYTSPAFIMVMSFFLFKEKLNRFKLLALILTFAGCFFVSGVTNTIISGGELALTPRALLLGLGSGFGYALYSIFSRYAIERGYNSLTITAYTFLFASVGSLFLTDLPQLGTVFIGSARGCLFCVGIALLGTLIPYISYTAGLGGMDNGRASVIVSIEPAVATIVSLVVFKEAISGWGILGIIFILSAAIIVNLSGEKRSSFYK